MRNRERIQEITDKLHEGIKALFESGKYADYLRTMSKFSSYSFNNTILIAMQRPDASAVAGFKAWERNFDRHVVKGAKGIAIIQPAPYKKTVEETVLDADGNTVYNQDGSKMTREVEKIMEGYKVGYVFALEDTEGTPLPSIVSTLNGDVPNYDEFIDVLKTVSPVPIIYEPINSRANGFFNLETRDIHVDSSLPELQRLKTTVHEMAHSLLHDKIIGEDQEANRFEREVCAESVAYTVMSYYGFDTSDYSFGYIAGWSEGKELKELQSKMSLIQKTSNTLITSIDKEFLKRRMSEADELTFKCSEGYIHIQKASDGGYDFSLYDQNLCLIDGGRFDSEQTMDGAAVEIMQSLDIDPDAAVLQNGETFQEHLANAATQKDDLSEKNTYDEKQERSCHIRRKL